MAATWAATVTVVTRTASGMVRATPAPRAAAHTTPASSAQAPTMAATTAGPGIRRRARPARCRRCNHAPPPTASPSATATSSNAPAPDTSATTPSPSTPASAARPARSAPRSATVEAMATWGSTPARRTTEVTRSGSPSRNGSTWLPSRATCTPATPWPTGTSGTTRCHAQPRRTKASAYRPTTARSGAGSATTDRRAARSAATSTDRTTTTVAATVTSRARAHDHGVARRARRGAAVDVEDTGAPGGS